MDEQLNVDDVCVMFGQHVKFIVSQTLALVREGGASFFNMHFPMRLRF